MTRTDDAKRNGVARGGRRMSRNGAARRRQGARVSAAREKDGGKKKKALVKQGLQIADKPSPSAGFLFFNGVMLKTPMPTQHELEMVTLEE
ncbi:hypothetical protein, partial [Burkholderia pseudomallei]